MAKKVVSEAFLEYEEFIAKNPAYEGMPDLRYADGRIQWEAPSNRKSGEFRFSHDRRQAWWEAKADQLGISRNQAHWISKVAKQIHPTKKRPCMVCGRVMDIRYAYLNSGFIRAVSKLPYIDGGIKLEETTHIFDFITEFEDLYGTDALNDLRKVLECKAVEDIPSFNSADDMIAWLDEVYIPAEPSRLSPGAMSDAPDRLDGFHTYNRCCRAKADKGRSKINLASYSTDRRAFEYWVDGNWVQANKAMGLFRADESLKALKCLNYDDGEMHPTPCDADHIGPISLGFMHRPVFQPLCSSCNSAKNNRMYETDVEKLIADEQNGQVVVTWYAKAVWDELKQSVHSSDDAVKLSRIMRDNRHNAMWLLGELLRRGHYLYLATLLNLNYADFTYNNPQIDIHKDATVVIDFDSRPSNLKYKQVQKSRRLRVGFQALRDYNAKENRNWYTVNNDKNIGILDSAEGVLADFESQHGELNNLLANFFANDFVDDEAIKEVVDEIPSSIALNDDPRYVNARSEVQRYMDNIGLHLADMWNDPRYARDVYDDFD